MNIRIRTFIPALAVFCLLGAPHTGICSHLLPRGGSGLRIASQDSAAGVQAAEKSPKAAMLRSLAFPGWGQFYNEQYIKAALAFSAESFLVGLSFYLNNKARNETDPLQKDFYIDRRNLTYWLIGATILFSMLDAYIDAHLYDFDTGPDLAMRFGVQQVRFSAQVSSPVLGVSLRAQF